MNRCRVAVVSVLCAFFFFTGSVLAQDPAATARTARPGIEPGGGGQPLWELGLVGGAGYFPDYPAAEQSHWRYLALPLVRYRGEIIRSDEKGLLRGRLVRTRDLELDVSLNGSFPADSDDNDARAGMPDIDWLGEVGPRLQWTVARAARDIAKIELELPLRAVFSTDLHDSLDYRGVIFAPEMAYQHRDFLWTGIGVKLGIGPVFATEELHDYFYEVEPRFATGTRAAYDAEAGYLGTNVTLSAVKELTPWVALLGRVQGRFHQGAANEDSPLFRQDTGFAAGLALAVTFAKSRRQVPPSP